jgi:hypothetical protein
MTSEAALSAAAAAVVPGKKNKPKAAESPAADGGRRAYLGYMVRVYYHDQLQAVTANPRKLLDLFPTPTTAPAQ